MVEQAAGVSKGAGKAAVSQGADEVVQMIGSGSSADALRNELKTGQPTKGKLHMQKVQDSLIYFKNWKKSNPNASKKDVEAVDDMIKDLEDALGYN